MGAQMNILKEGLRRVYVNPYSKERRFILEETEKGLCICFKEFYILLSEKDNKWSVEEYEDEQDVME